jgi:hypothetical protein
VEIQCAKVSYADRPEEGGLASDLRERAQTTDAHLEQVVLFRL